MSLSLAMSATTLQFRRESREVRPGDAIGFSGRDLASDVVNLATWGWPRWGISHVAIATYHHQFGLCLCESTTLIGDDQPCLIRHEPVAGVQFQPIGRRIRKYPGRIWHYPLRKPLTNIQAAGLNKWLESLALAECPYDMVSAIRSRATLYAAACRWMHKHPEDLKSLFCSETLGAAWDRYDVMQIENASDWNPNALLRAALRQDVVLPPHRIK